MSKQNITEFITIKNLRALAGGGSYERGQEYFEEGAVGPVSEQSDAISAKVHGSRTYNVRLKVIRFKECTLIACPMVQSKCRIWVRVGFVATVFQ